MMISILVVDDDEDLLEMIAIMLQTNGFMVETINAGQKLFDHLANHSPDVIILDIYLGDSDGRDLCRQLKDDNRYANIPVVLYSAVNIPESSIDASGANSFLQKPFNMSDMTRTIGELRAKTA